MRCKIAATFGKFPIEVAALPLSEYILCRNYVLAMDEEMAGKPDDPLGTETWGETNVAKAPWETESVTAIG
jgi:hypothetical protein